MKTQWVYLLLPIHKPMEQPWHPIACSGKPTCNIRERQSHLGTCLALRTRGGRLYNVDPPKTTVDKIIWFRTTQNSSDLT